MQRSERERRWCKRQRGAYVREHHLTLSPSIDLARVYHASVLSSMIKVLSCSFNILFVELISSKCAWGRLNWLFTVVIKRRVRERERRLTMVKSFLLAVHHRMNCRLSFNRRSRERKKWMNRWSSYSIGRGQCTGFFFFFFAPFSPCNSISYSLDGVYQSDEGDD